MSAFPLITQSMYQSYASKVEDALVELLQHETVGFVAIAKQLAEAQSVDLPEFTLSDDDNYLHRVNVSPADFLAAGEPSFPAFLVHVDVTADTHRTLSQDFSGQLNAGIDIILSDDITDLPYDLQRLTNVFIDTLYGCFGIANSAVFQGYNISFNGGVRVNKSKAIRSAENWMCVLTAQFPLFIN